eukprot:5700306-Alexandrium_andersonii.AAC.1
MAEARSLHIRAPRRTLPVVQFDCTFPKFFADDDITVLAGVDVTTGLSTAALLPGQNLTGHATAAVENFRTTSLQLRDLLQTLHRLHTSLRLQSA